MTLTQISYVKNFPHLLSEILNPRIRKLLPNQRGEIFPDFYRVLPWVDILVPAEFSPFQGAFALVHIQAGIGKTFQYDLLCDRGEPVLDEFEGNGFG